MIINEYLSKAIKIESITCLVRLSDVLRMFISALAVCLKILASRPMALASMVQPLASRIEALASRVEALVLA